MLVAGASAIAKDKDKDTMKKAGMSKDGMKKDHMAKGGMKKDAMARTR